MRSRRFALLATVGAMTVCFQLGSNSLHAQTPAAALTGVVNSAEEGAMEGVLVSAQKTGSPITITVVSDEQGRFSFPTTQLGPGQYSLRIRAIGYELDGTQSADVAAQKSTSVNLRLRKTKDLAAQLSNAEWLESAPGTAAEKNVLLGCTGCHTLERVMRSQHSSDDFIKVVLPRMQGYVNQSTPLAPQLRKGERLMEERGDQRVQIYKALGDYLARLNLSAGPGWNFELKTFSRPKGRATRVVYTEYDLPRKVIQPHDVIVDADGIVWYSSFGEHPPCCLT
jgi:virginiamycin B lyase